MKLIIYFESLIGCRTRYLQELGVGSVDNEEQATLLNKCKADKVIKEWLGWNVPYWAIKTKVVK